MGMVSGLLGYLSLFFAIGFGMALMAVLGFWRFGRRRPLFRFGGDDPFSWGDRKQWTLWMIFGYVFAFLTTFKLFSQSGFTLYGELALSIVEGPLIAMGLFVVDRLAMFFEPEYYWHPEIRKQYLLEVATGKTEHKVSVSADTSVITELPSVSPDPVRNDGLSDSIAKLDSVLGEFDDGSKSYVCRMAENVSEQLSEKADEAMETAQTAMKKTGGVLSGFINELKNRRERREARRKAETEQRRSNFEDIIRGH